MKNDKLDDAEPEVTPVASKLDAAITLLYEKVCHEYGIPLEDVRSATIIIKDGQVAVRSRGKSDE